MSPMNKTFDVKRLPDLLSPDRQRKDLARRRQSAVWRGEKPDHFPICFSTGLTEEQEHIPDANFKEAFYSKELMLCSQLRAACAVPNARSDAVPSIRSNLGTGILLACIGLEQTVYDDKMPWLHEHLTRKDIAKLEPADINIQGSFARGIDQMRFFKGINFGHVPGRKHDHPFEQDLELCRQTGTVYFGNWPKYEEETDRQYVRRLHKWAARGCLIPQVGCEWGEEGSFETPYELMDFWHSLDTNGGHEK